MSFEKLPDELLDRIFQYVATKDIWFKIRLVSKRLYLRLTNKNYWIAKLRDEYAIRLPNMSREGDGKIILRSLEIAHSIGWWSNDCDGAKQVDSEHIGTIDAIKIFRAGNKRFCLTGARDRTLILWDLEAATDSLTPKSGWTSDVVKNAHKGWIWSIDTTPDGSSAWTSSWDNFVQQWHIRDGKLTADSNIKFDEAALNVIVDGHNSLYVSTYRKGPVFIDLRAGIKPQAGIMPQPGHPHGHSAVYELATKNDANMLYSIGEDNSLAAIEKRMFRIVTQRTFAVQQRLAHVDYNSGILAASLRNGSVQFLDPNDLTLKNEIGVSNHQSSSSGVINRWGNPCVKVTKGVTVCTTNDCSIQVYTPGLTVNQPRLIKTIGTNSNITKFDYFKGDLVASVDFGSLIFITEHRA